MHINTAGPQRLEFEQPCRGVGSGGPGGPRPHPPSFQKCPFSGGKVPFSFVKNVVQIVFLPQWPLIYDFIYFFYPTPVVNISVENFLGALFILKVPFETAPPPNFLMLPTPLWTTTAYYRMLKNANYSHLYLRPELHYTWLHRSVAIFIPDSAAIPLVLTMLLLIKNQ